MGPFREQSWVMCLSLSLGVRTAIREGPWEGTSKANGNLAKQSRLQNSKCKGPVVARADESWGEK